MEGTDIGSETPRGHQPLIAILTFHYSTNYGAVLQAMALSCFLRDQGVDCEVLDYRQRKGLWVYAKQLFINRHPLHGIRRYLKFRKYLRSKLPLSDRPVYRPAELALAASKFDGVVVGSDEVWKTQSFRGFDASFFLGFVDSTRLKLSFAASTGGQDSFGEHRDAIDKLLSDFDAISVRDDLSKKALAETANRPVVRLVDPTLLVEFPTASMLLPSMKDFVLVYGVPTDSELREISSYALDRGWRVVALGHYCASADLSVLDAGVEEWLGFFRTASCIVTSFFHGVVFGLKFHGEAVVLQRPDKAYKVQQLVDDLKLVEEPLSWIASPLGTGVTLKRLRHSECTAEAIATAQREAVHFVDRALTLLKNR